MLDRYGTLHRAPLDPITGTHCLDPTPAAYVGPGRPLGFHLDTGGRFFICDSLKGLLRLELASGDLAVLSNSAAGRPICYANDLDVASNGTVYFTDSTCIPPALNDASPRPWFDTMRSFMLTLYHGEPSGRLLAWDPGAPPGPQGRTRVVLDNLWFANGVALSADESFVAVCETCSMRVRRHYLKDPKAGQTDVLIDSLPGFPDNISRSSDGCFWVCLVAPDSPLLHVILRLPLLARSLAAAAGRMLPTPSPWGCVVKVSPDGRQVLKVFMDPDGSVVSHVSSVTEHGGALYVGNLHGDYVSVLDLKDTAPGS
jgi:sugar lactone lactonase YvrE